MEPQELLVSVSFTIRLCRADDLPGLEWFGSFRDHRAIIERTFAEMERGEQLMWVADRRGFPAGQIWLNVALGRLWAARVFWPLQGLGIGKRLAQVAERALFVRQRRSASVTVELANARARRFWMAEGYRPAGRVLEHWSYDTPDGVHVDAAEEQELLQKELLESELGDDVPKGGEHAGNSLDHR